MGEQVAARFLKKSFYSFCGNQAGVAIRKWKMYLENCTQRSFSLKEKRHQISMIRKSFYITVQRLSITDAIASFISIRLSAI